MYFAAGLSLYGKVDQVPGLFHVATKFFHLNHLPLLPTGSFLVDQRSDPPKEYPIPWSGKSILFAWLRFGLMLGGAGLALASFFFLLRLAEGHRVGHKLAAAATASVLLWFFLYRSYGFTRATPLRALELAPAAGVSPEQLARYFLDYEDLPDVNNMTTDDDRNLETPASSSNPG